MEPRPYNNDIEAYPRAYHPSTGEEMPFPSGDLERIPKDLRSEWFESLSDVLSKYVETTAEKYRELTR